MGFCRFRAMKFAITRRPVLGKIHFIKEMRNPLRGHKHLANGVHSTRLIHDFGFPGWPELNLD